MYRLLAAALSLVVVSCGGAGAPAPGAASPAPGAHLTIFAAASLTDAFNTIARDFTAAHPGVTVTPNYAGSSGLGSQIAQGADADVFASADDANMQKLVAAQLVAAPPRTFAHNRLQIVVHAGNPKHITQLADLARADLIVVLGAPAVPIGAYAAQALQSAGVAITPRSLENDVKLVVAKVALGEADAGIVYSTDVRAGGAKIEGVDIPDRSNVIASYPIAVVKGTRNEALARAFVDLIVSPRGQEVLASFGFLP